MNITELQLFFDQATQRYPSREGNLQDRQRAVKLLSDSKTSDTVSVIDEFLSVVDVSEGVAEMEGFRVFFFNHQTAFVIDTVHKTFAVASLRTCVLFINVCRKHSHEPRQTRHP